MKMKPLYVFILAAVIIFGFFIVASGKGDRNNIVNVEKIRVVEGADLAAIAATQADMIIVCDRATTIPVATLPFPVTPIDGQIFSVSSRVQITTLTLDAGAIPISGSISTLAAGGAASWIYDLTSNRWFRNP